MNKLKKAIDILKQGGIVIYPTDTVFGIGCRIDDQKAIKRLFTIRQRPLNQPTPVLVNSIKMAEDLFSSSLSDNVRRLMKDYWPGAVTIIYNCKKRLVPDLVRGSGDTLGIRIPNHQTAISLIKGVGVPILGPSANFHGKETPYSFAKIDKRLLKLVDYAIDGECTLKKMSTVIDCSHKSWQILRQGAVRIDISKSLEDN